MCMYVCLCVLCMYVCCVCLRGVYVFVYVSIWVCVVTIKPNFPIPRLIPCSSATLLQTRDIQYL